MNQAVLSLGSNVGNRLHYLQKAKEKLQKNNCKIILQSSVYETQAWGNTNQDSFYNEVIQIETTLSAEELMHSILNIEKSLGRIRKQKWEPRTIDIDILFFNDEIIHKDHLTIPHPHIHERKFILIPLNEILPHMLHPILQKNIATLLSELNDSLEVKKV